MSAPSRPFTPAWLAEDASALRFLPDGYRRAADRADAVGRAALRRVDPAVLDSLVATTPAQHASREALARGAVAVVTGQQAGLFGGPLYTLYKAAAAIADARALQLETGCRCVPVFWLQDEDHDFAEIATTDVLGPVTVPAQPGDEGRSVAARRLGPAVLEALDLVAARLSGLSEAAPTVDLLRRCYRPDVSPAGAFRELVEAWLAPHGLLVLDPWTLREAALPVHRRAFDDAERISTVLLERSEALRAAGFDVQVHVRPGAPLSFVHPDGPDGPRIRVDGPVEGAFSTSALLRPILQDTWLPTAAYVGGPGEIAYFAQLPPLYAHLGLPMPLVVPRARFRVVDDGAARLLDQLGLAPDDLALPRDVLLARLARRRDEDPDPDALAAAAVALRDAIAPFHPVDPKAAEKTAATVTDAVGKLADRVRRTLAARDEVTVDRLDRLRARLQPGGAPQERVHSWPWYGARYGEGFVRAVLDAVVPFSGDLVDLRP